jgi:hypothetical protein
MAADIAGVVESESQSYLLTRQTYVRIYVDKSEAIVRTGLLGLVLANGDVVERSA